MKYLISIIFCICLLYQPDALVAQANQFAEIRQTIETAVDSTRPDMLIELNTKLANIEESENQQVRKYAFYYSGYSYYRLQASFSQVGEDQKEKYLEEAVVMLEKAVEIDPEFAEAQALLGSCYGIKASGFFSGMKYGPKSDAAMEKALNLAPENPRVVLLNAIGTLLKPGMFGGSTEGAIEGFQRAEELYQTWQTPNEFAPRWGNAEVYAWLGQGYTQAEEYDKARQAYYKALKIKPGYPWVKELLLPGLNENTN